MYKIQKKGKLTVSLNILKKCNMNIPSDCGLGRNWHRALIPWINPQLLQINAVLIFTSLSYFYLV